MKRRLAVEVLMPGRGLAPALVLDAPLSFWGGVEPASGLIIDRQHPQHGASIAGTVLMLPGVRGSTAAPGALLECLAADRGPAAILMRRLEVVPLVTALAGRLLEQAPPALALLAHEADQAAIRTGHMVHFDGDDWSVAVD